MYLGSDIILLLPCTSKCDLMNTSPELAPIPRRG